VDYFLGIEVHRSDFGSLLLTQTKYIRHLLTKANMENTNSMASPMASSTKLTMSLTPPSSDPLWEVYKMSLLPGLRSHIQSIKFVSSYLPP
jgi:hypothetical protein